MTQRCHLCGQVVHGTMLEHTENKCKEAEILSSASVRRSGMPSEATSPMQSGEDYGINANALAKAVEKQQKE